MVEKEQLLSAFNQCYGLNIYWINGKLFWMGYVSNTDMLPPPPPPMMGKLYINIM